MAVKIRLRRMGAKKKPFYRIVVADSRSPRDGRCIEEIGYYNPVSEPVEIKIDDEKDRNDLAKKFIEVIVSNGLENDSEKEKGQLLFVDCKSRKETIRDMNPPNSTIAGTYHALADEPVLGWHPSWEKLFKK